MICRASYFHDTDNYKDTPLAVISVDEKLIKVMKAAIILEIREAADYLSADMDSDEYMDAVNYIRDLTESLKDLNKSLGDITEVPEAEGVMDE